MSIYKFGRFLRLQAKVLRSYSQAHVLLY